MLYAVVLKSYVVNITTIIPKKQKKPSNFNILSAITAFYQLK